MLASPEHGGNALGQQFEWEYIHKKTVSEVGKRRLNLQISADLDCF